MRSALQSLPMQEGVLEATGQKVTQRASGGANMSVDVAAGACWVKGDTSVRQGLYHVYNDAVLNLTIGANASGSPRLDQIICRVNDTIDGGAGTDTGSIEVLAGTATGGATLDNRSGAAALPSTAVRLADVLVASGAASITNTNIRDRRPWAAGGIILANGDNGTNFTTASSSPVTITGTDLRLECSANTVVEATFSAFVLNSAAASVLGYFAQNGVEVTGSRWQSSSHAGTNPHWVSHTVLFVPSVGSNVFTWTTWATGGGTATITNSGGVRWHASYREHVRPNASNS
jgi:hypothetical protein